MFGYFESSKCFKMGTNVTKWFWMAQEIFKKVLEVQNISNLFQCYSNKELNYDDDSSTLFQRLYSGKRQCFLGFCDSLVYSLVTNIVEHMLAFP